MLLWRGLSLLCTVEGGASAVPKPSCIQFSILKNACQPQLLSLKIGEKKSKDRKIRNIGKSFFVFYDFLAKIPVLGHILDCFSTLCGMYLMRFFSCPGQLSLTDILIQSLSRFYFTVLRAKLYFTSSSFGFWDIFGMLICIWNRFQLHIVDLVVWWLRDDTVYAKLWSNISSGGTSSKPSCKCGSKNAQLSRIVGGLESSVGVLFYFSWFQMILSQKHDWPWIVIFSHGTTDGSRMVGEIA